MKYNFFSSSSILRKFLVFNFIVFLVLGIFTFFYLKATKPNLVKKRSDEHSKIIKNTSDHINRLNIEFTKEGATKFLLSTRFLFQNLDRVQLYNLDFELNDKKSRRSNSKSSLRNSKASSNTSHEKLIKHGCDHLTK